MGERGSGIEIQQPYLRTRAAFVASSAAFVLSACMRPEGGGAESPPQPEAVASSASPEYDAPSEPESFSQDELNEWAKGIVEANNCNNEAELDAFWSEIPYADNIVVISGCEGAAHGYDSLEDAQKGDGNWTMSGIEGETFWRDEEANEGNEASAEILEVVQFTITDQDGEYGVEKNEEFPIYFRSEDLITRH